ncbi:molybdate ABC transporter substrate-binding protein [Jannaschia sp. Os4]|uniref:molybdate ABC transporter substrate-binding protein n=1 Tax=Jannaschia sp. Os4 TaxID=2807617 RepID=UPI00193A57A0|nr:molybdate ABC transporter substrate-binding protein [Jannaschia sp. Os4]MBM2577621.1 molybdate ABC transporter substrate-binding protein [Jannaschia sp. Os4]
MTERRSPSDPTRRRVLGCGLGAALLAAPLVAAAPLTVFAAASLKGPLDEIAAARGARVAYGGSGLLARQVAAGAPADVVVLAATDWADWLAAQGATRGGVVDVAGNRLALAGPAGAAPVDLSAQALEARLGSGRLAMGDPMSVPAGRYAQQALETLGAWGALSERLLLSESVTAALAYVARGAAPLGLVYGSDLRRADVAEVAAIPATAHAPIRYPAAVTARAAPGAEALLAAIADARPTFAAHGFA